MKNTQPKPQLQPGAKYEPYKGEELKPFAGRPGAMDAYKLPSMQGPNRVQPKHNIG